jgi:hypothetical protein
MRLLVLSFWLAIDSAVYSDVHFGVSFVCGLFAIFSAFAGAFVWVEIEDHKL